MDPNELEEWGIKYVFNWQSEKIASHIAFNWQSGKIASHLARTDLCHRSQPGLEDAGMPKSTA